MVAERLKLGHFPVEVCPFYFALSKYPRASFAVSAFPASMTCVVKISSVDWGMFNRDGWQGQQQSGQVSHEAVLCIARHPLQALEEEASIRPY